MLLVLVRNMKFVLCNVGYPLSHTSYIKRVFQSVSRGRGADRHEALDTLAHRKNVNENNLTFTKISTIFDTHVL